MAGTWASVRLVLLLLVMAVLGRAGAAAEAPLAPFVVSGEWDVITIGDRGSCQ